MLGNGNPNARSSNESYLRRSREIEGQMKNIRESRKVYDMMELEAQCACCHRGENKEICLIPPKNGGKMSKFTQKPLFRCRRCGAEIDISPITVEKFDEALDTMVNAGHIAKMFLDIDKETNAQLADSIKRYMFFLKTSFRDAFLATRRKAPSKKKTDAYAGVFS